MLEFEFWMGLAQKVLVGVLLIAPLLVPAWYWFRSKDADTVSYKIQTKRESTRPVRSAHIYKVNEPPSQTRRLAISVMPKPIATTATEITVKSYRILKTLSSRHPAYHRQIRRQKVSVPPPVSLWQEQGWVKQGTTWHGAYRVAGKCWLGRAEPGIGNCLSFYIIDPPARLLTGPHGRCYVPKGDKGHWVHFEPQKPRNLSQGIGAVEYHLAQVV